MSVTVKPTVTNCSGTIWFTDLMLQEGPALTGYVPHTESRLAKNDKVWFNGVVRSAETVIVCNLEMCIRDRYKGTKRNVESESDPKNAAVE